MKNSKLHLIYVLMISISIVFVGVWVGNSIRNANKDTNPNQSSSLAVNSKALMTEKEAAEYLNLSQDKLSNLISNEESQREKLSSYDTYMFIPFISIDGVKYFDKDQIDKWIEYKITRWSEIDTNIK